MNYKYLIIAAAWLMCSCADKRNSEPTLHSVYTTVVERNSDEITKVYSGIVEENATVGLGFKTAGQIKKIFVKEGQTVHQGQLLAELDDVDYRLGVEALQIQYNQTKAEVERAHKLFEKKSISANDYEKATAGLQQLAVQLKANQNKLAYTRLYAPATGVIEKVNFSASEMVDAGTTVFSLLDISNMQVVCDIPARTYLQRARFCSFSCKPTHSDDGSYPLQLLSIVPKADGNQLYRMNLGFASATDGAISAGMNVEVSIGIRPESENITVPASAVFLDDNSENVWVLQPDSTVTKRQVWVDHSSSGKDVHITSGLEAGETIVRVGVSALQQGEKVRVIEKPSKTNAGGLL